MIRQDKSTAIPDQVEDMRRAEARQLCRHFLHVCGAQGLLSPTAKRADIRCGLYLQPAENNDGIFCAPYCLLS